MARAFAGNGKVEVLIWVTWILLHDSPGDGSHILACLDEAQPGLDAGNHL
jgi:hypothetical protein